MRAAPCTFVIGEAMYRPGLDEDRWMLTVEDEEGTYAIPYIRTSRDIELRIEFHDPELESVEVAFDGASGMSQEVELVADDPEVRLLFFQPSEYVFSATGRDEDGEEIFSCEASGLGVGDVFIGLGDSITEGYRGRGFFTEDFDLDATAFPDDAVSRDGRNYPQYAPTAAKHMPEVNTFESWMPRLNDLLTDAFAHPVFIANEGWGGYTTADIRRLMDENTCFRRRMDLLEPNWWLIHLGVNDERAGRSAAAVAADLEAIVTRIEDDWGGARERILVAKPCWDRNDGAEAILAEYCAAVDALVERLGVAPGPDFFSAYAEETDRWYGSDPVHPNEAGMARMADLWRDAVVAARNALDAE